MKKKMLVVTAAIASAVMLVLGGSDVALAASRTDTAEVLGATRSREDAGEAAVLGANRDSAVDLDYTEITDEKALSDLADLKAIMNVINAYHKAQNDGRTVTISDLEVLDSFDITVPEDVVVNAENPLYITFAVPGVTADTTVYLLHYTEAGVWEIVPSITGDGYVYGAFTGTSPVAIVLDKSTVTAKSSSKGTGNATSPRTGDNQLVFVIIFAVIAVACVSFTFISLKKEKKN